jgi:Tfp pilus assembly protein PilW
MMKTRLLHRKRGGYTLLELTLSIAFYTVIVTIALVGFIGIFGIYNKVQGLTRTQEETRKGMDALTRDLRQTTGVTYPVVSDVRHAHCLTVDNNQPVGYGLKRVGATDQYALARSTSCTDYANAVFVTSTDVWSDKNPFFQDAGTQPLQISAVTTAGSGGSGPKVWQVRFATFRGISAPTMTSYNSATNQFGAGTMLQSLIVARGE